MREKQLVKLLKAVDLMARPQGASINELREAIAVGRSSVYRIIETLQEMQFPVYDDKSPDEPNKRWHLAAEYVKKMPNITVPEISLTFSEMIALYLLKGEAALYKGTRLEAEALSAFEKIGSFLPAQILPQLSKIKTLFIPPSKFVKDYSGKEAIIDTLADAILTRKICMVSYFSFSLETEKQYLIAPLHFFESNGGMYVFVRVPKYDTIRTLAVERIQKIEKSTESFDYPDNFDPEKLLESSFDMVYDDPVDIKLWISRKQAKYIRERKFFRSQTITENDDGSLTLDIRTSGWEDVKRWILSLGADAVVLAPGKRKKEIRDALNASVNRYEQSSHH